MTNFKPDMIEDPKREGSYMEDERRKERSLDLTVDVLADRFISLLDPEVRELIKSEPRDLHFEYFNLHLSQGTKSMILMKRMYLLKIFTKIQKVSSKSI